jgi:hypothetical protein
MTDEQLAMLIAIYGIGYMITLFSIEVPDTAYALNRRIFLWPFYWAYLAFKFAYAVREDFREWRR